MTLLLALLFAAVGTATADAPTSGSWSDNADGDWASGYTEDNDFYISTPEQLAQLAKMVNKTGRQFAGKTVRLMADIDLSAHYWVPIGRTETHAFAGTFDGEGHTISGISIGTGSLPTTGNVFCGLFGVTATWSTVRNVTMASSTLEAVYNVGGVVAYNKGTVEGCRVGSDVSIRSTAADDSNKAIRFGGIVASNTGTVRGCLSHADMADHRDKNRSYIGGVVGHNFGRVENCVYLGNVETLGYKADDAYSEGKNTRIGPIVGFSVTTGSARASYGDNFYTQSAEVFAVIDAGKTDASMAYAIVQASGSTDFSISFDTPSHGVVWNGMCYAPSGQTVLFRIVPSNFNMGVGSVTANGITLTASMGKYSVSVASADITIEAEITNAGTGPTGSGTNDDPYIIKSAKHWDVIANEIINGNSNINKDGVTFFRLDADISVSTMMGSEAHPFESSFDGNGHTLTFNNNSGDYCAPFQYVRNAEISNLIVDGSISPADDSNYAGGIIGHAEGLTTIYNCVVRASMDASGGCIVGYVDSEKKGEDSYGPSSVNLVACVYDGSIIGSVSTSLCGFVGKVEGRNGDAKASVTFTNCLFDPKKVSDWSSSHTVVIEGDHSEVSSTGHLLATKVSEVLGNLCHQAVVSIAKPDGKPIQSYGVLDQYDDGLYYNGLFYKVESGNISLPADKDNTPLISYLLGRGDTQVTLANRILYKDGCWNSLCLPFDIDDLSQTDLAGAIVKEMDVDGWYNAANVRSDTQTAEYCYQTGLVEDALNEGRYNLHLYFKEATRIEAGKPYLLKWTKPDGYEANPVGYDVLNPSFSDVSIKADLTTVENYDGSVLFVPIYAPTELEASWTNLYVGGDNKLVYPTADSSNKTLRAFRAYFLLGQGDEPATEPLAPGLSIVTNIGDEDIPGGATAIGDAVRQHHPAATDDAQPIYDLQGRPVANGECSMEKGLYITRGKKIIIK